jgi:hypothetical protein
MCFPCGDWAGIGSVDHPRSTVCVGGFDARTGLAMCRATTWRGDLIAAYERGWHSAQRNTTSGFHMALSGMAWTEISSHQVIAEYLRSERDKFAFPPWLDLIDHPNLSDPLENHKRRRLFLIRRGVLWNEIPADTQWFEVNNLTDSELDELYLSARHTSEWDAAGSQLNVVARVARLPLTAPPDRWPRIILWGHDKSGPFSILEGNHRMLAYAYASPRPAMNVTAYVGLSPSYCFWHRLDPGLSLNQGLSRLKLPPAQYNGEWLYIDENFSETVTISS